MFNKRVLAICLLLIATAAQARAPQPTLAQLDKNGDALLSREEYGAMPSRDSSFERRDINNDQRIDVSEWSIRPVDRAR